MRLHFVFDCCRGTFELPHIVSEKTCHVSVTTCVIVWQMVHSKQQSPCFISARARTEHVNLARITCS